MSAIALMILMASIDVLGVGWRYLCLPAAGLVELRCRKCATRVGRTVFKDQLLALIRPF